jgi:acyl carrier protein
MYDKITEDIIEFISTTKGIPRDIITPQFNFVSDLGLDSLSMMELVFEIEDRYGLSLTCTPSEISTIEDLAKILNKFIDKNKVVV